MGFAPCAESAEEPDELSKLRDQSSRLDWRLNQAQRQFGRLLAEIKPLINAEARRRIMQQLGQQCARSLGWAERFKGDPEGFFQHMKNHSGETLTFDASGRAISVITRERHCDCPLVADAAVPRYYCDCSLGWQMETYETILGKPVEAVIKESVLRGSTRCAFEIRIV